MNELARLVPFIFTGQACRITDREGNPWFAAKDVAEILDISSYRRTIATFPVEEKAYVTCAVFSKHGTSAGCDVYSIYGTSAKSRARKTQKLLIISEAGVMRLILKSRKKNAWEFKERIIKVVSYFRKHGVNWAVLSRNWVYGGKELTWTEYVNRKSENYLKRHPDATFEDFLATLPF